MAPQADATISSQTMLDKRSIQENQMKNFTVDANFVRPPDFHIYIFNVSPKPFEVWRPPLMPRVQIPGIEKGQKYRLAFKLPNIVNQCWADADTGLARIAGFDGRRVAMDIINPANITLDQDLQMDPKNVFGEGVDLSWCVFWSLNEIPTEKEMTKAIDKMEKYFRALLQQADDFARAGQYNKIQPDHFMAADHFRYKGVWNTRVEVPEDCPLCGGPIKKGAIVHAGPDGCHGVLDWKKAVAAGLKSREDVPIEARWWKEEAKKEPKTI